MEKDYPFIKQLMPLPDNVEVMMIDKDTGEEWYCGDNDNCYPIVMLALVEECSGRGGRVFTEVYPYIIDSDGQGDIEDGSSNISIRIVPKRKRGE